MPGGFLELRNIMLVSTGEARVFGGWPKAIALPQKYTGDESRSKDEFIFCATVQLNFHITYHHLLGTISFQGEFAKGGSHVVWW